jgi:hypothetical protein
LTVPEQRPLERDLRGNSGLFRNIPQRLVTVRDSDLITWPAEIMGSLLLGLVRAVGVGRGVVLWRGVRGGEVEGEGRGVTRGGPYVCEALRLPRGS